ncbi:MAG TPA: carbamoyl phosphate synthase, partial [Microthrixaceae bacterium]|nr:carbamoyl phosphate synthase [Microthrixaceae bacterium]
GNCVYLGTRDCSAQRRHQKLIEEAPAANIPAEIITQMGEAAVAVAKGCDYVNAGTVEFLYEDGGFFYLEMNTRLQVEHCVSEEVTSKDLVELQLRVASGEPLPFTQDDIEIHGHAIEVRINAENVAEGKFLPSPGKIDKLRVPSGIGVRWDGGYEEGDEISQYYDNLAGKLVVWAKDRQTAINRTIRALEEFVIEGVATTIPADLAILKAPEFQAFEHSTKWVESGLDLTGVGVDPVAASDEDDEPKVRRTVDVEVNGKRFSVAMYLPEGAGFGGGAGAGGGAKKKKAKRGSGAAAGPAKGSGTLVAPMQGTIVKVVAAVGDTVTEGDTICVLEAMKMENAIVADKDGTIATLSVEAGQAVGSGDVLAVIE